MFTPEAWFTVPTASSALPCRSGQAGVLSRMESRPPEREIRKCRFCCGTGVKHPENTGAQFNCWDCKEACGDYMVKTAVWEAAMPEYARIKREMKAKFAGTPEEFRITVRLCVRCLGVRLKRALLPEDFTDARINDMLRLGVSMGRKSAVDAHSDE